MVRTSERVPAVLEGDGANCGGGLLGNFLPLGHPPPPGSGAIGRSRSDPPLLRQSLLLRWRTRCAPVVQASLHDRKRCTSPPSQRAQALQDHRDARGANANPHAPRQLNPSSGARRLPEGRGLGHGGRGRGQAKRGCDARRAASLRLCLRPSAAITPSVNARTAAGELAKTNMHAEP